MQSTRPVFFSTKKMVVLALCSAVCVVGRLFTQVIPNVQPVTAIIIMLALYVGGVEAFLVSSVTMVITSLFLGMGIWTVAQIMAYGLIIVMITILNKKTAIASSLSGQVVLNFLVGGLYGFILSICFAPAFGIQQFFVYYLQGLPFDLLHGIGNVAFYLVLKDPFGRVLKHFELTARK